MSVPPPVPSASVRACRQVWWRKGELPVLPPPQLMEIFVLLSSWGMWWGLPGSPEACRIKISSKQE